MRQKPDDDSRISLPGSLRRCAEVLKRAFKKPQTAEQSLRAVVLPTDMNPQSLGDLTQNLPDVFSAFFNHDIGLLPKDAAKEGELSPIELADIASFTSILAERLVSPPADISDIELSIGLGGSEYVPNIRIASYILPALRTLVALDGLREKGVISALPKLVIFKADHMAHTVNRFDSEQLAKVTRLTFDFLNEFSQRFFPNIVDSIQFAIDKDPLVDTELMSRLQMRKDTLAQHTESSAVRSVIAMGQKHGGDAGSAEALLYTAAHADFPGLIPNGERDLLPVVVGEGVLRQEGLLTKPSMVVTYGGRPQNVFNCAARVLMDHAGTPNRPPSVGLIIAAGKVPPYYPAQRGDVPLGVDFNGDISHVDSHTKADYSTLYEVIPQEAFVDFVKTFTAARRDLIDEITSFRPHNHRV